MLLGILAGLAAGALWGFIFLAPHALPNYSASDIALGRYAVYGLISALSLLYQYKRVRKIISLRMAGNAAYLSCLSCSLYYFLLAASIKYSGIATASLIIGLLPVTIPVFSGDKIRKPKLFYSSLVMICAGLLVLNLPVLADMLTKQALSSDQVSGVFLAFFALMSWTAYGLLNAKLLAKHPEIDLNIWSSLLGVFAFVTIIPVWLITNTSAASISSSRFTDPSFMLWMSLVGAGSAWLAMFLWNYASRKLPTAITGQLIISETIFSLLYGYIYNHQLPVISEVLAGVLLIAGVVLGFYSFRNKLAAS